MGLKTGTGEGGAGHVGFVGLLESRYSEILGLVGGRVGCLRWWSGGLNLLWLCHFEVGDGRASYRCLLNRGRSGS